MAACSERIPLLMQVSKLWCDTLPSAMKAVRNIRQTLYEGIVEWRVVVWTIYSPNNACVMKSGDNLCGEEILAQKDSGGSLQSSRDMSQRTRDTFSGDGCDSILDLRKRILRILPKVLRTRGLVGKCIEVRRTAGSCGLNFRT